MAKDVEEVAEIDALFEVSAEEEAENTNLEDTKTEEEPPAEGNLEQENESDDESTEGMENTQDEQTEENKEENVDTQEPTIDPAFQEEFEKYKNFHDALTQAEFTANGKKVKGKTTVEDLIKSQQLAHGYADKVRGLKKTRPFITALEKNGLLENEEKFNTLLAIANGDTEALKQFMKSSDINPYDLDMDEIKYESKNHLPSEGAIILEDIFQEAKNLDVADSLSVMLDGLDQPSLELFVKTPKIKDVVLNHMAEGVYEDVVAEIADMKMYNKMPVGLTSLQEYEAATHSINNKILQANAELEQQQQQHLPQPQGGDSNEGIDFEMLKQQAQQNIRAKEVSDVIERLKAKADKGIENKKLDDQRRAASFSSTKGNSTAKQSGKAKPLTEYSVEELDDIFSSVEDY
jgi:hypothetical protein